MYQIHYLKIYILDLQKYVKSKLDKNVSDEVKSICNNEELFINEIQQTLEQELDIFLKIANNEEDFNSDEDF